MRALLYFICENHGNGITWHLLAGDSIEILHENGIM
jgi:hypothetical protein